MNIERIGTLGDLDALEHEWRELEGELPRLPFVSYDWVRAWWEHLHADRPTVRDELFILAFRDGERLRAVAPLMRTLRPGHGPLRLRHLQFLGADPNITEIRTLAAPPAATASVISGLVTYLHEAASEWDFLQLTGVSGAAADELGGSIGADRWVAEIPNYHLTLLPTWEEFKGGLSRNIKESLRKCYNAPKRDGLSFKLEVLRSPESATRGVEQFLSLHETRANREDTVQHPNVFASQAGREFLHDVCVRFARRDRLRLFQLKLDDRVIATRIGLCCGDTLYLYYSGYDPEFARYSVMTTTVAEAIQFAIREGFRHVNLSTGNDVSKLRWGPQETLYREALLVSPSLRGTLTYGSYAWVRKRMETALSGSRLAAVLSRKG